MISRSVQAFGLLAVLAGFAAYLVRSYSLIGYSDPLKWYAFAREFTDSFGSARLAYGFPLFQAGAIALVGPLRGFLVNLPILVALCAVVYELGRRHAGGKASTLVAPLAGAGALSFWIGVDHGRLLQLVSPYRDPFSHSFLALSCVLLIAARQDRRRAIAWATGSGLCLAVAASARETAVLMLLPFALYAWVAKHADPELPVVRPLLGFGAALAAAGVPLLVQNYLVSGSPYVPGQMARWLDERGEFVPGIRFEHLGETLPAAVRFLAGHYGGSVAWLALGLTAAVRHRVAEVLFLSLPALLLYLVFYGAYERVVERYFLVVDVFAAPIAGLGVAWAASGALRAIADGRRRKLATHAALLAALLPALVAPWLFGRATNPRFQLAQVQELRRFLSTHIPEGSTVVGDRPLTEMTFCFAADLFDVRHRVRDVSRLERLLETRDVVYVLSKGWAAPQLGEHLRATPVATLEGSRYRVDPFRLSRVEMIAPP